MSMGVYQSRCYVCLWVFTSLGVMYVYGCSLVQVLCMSMGVHQSWCYVCLWVVTSLGVMYVDGCSLVQVLCMSMVAQIGFSIRGSCLSLSLIANHIQAAIFLGYFVGYCLCLVACVSTIIVWVVFVQFVQCSSFIKRRCIQIKLQIGPISLTPHQKKRMNVTRLNIMEY